VRANLNKHSGYGKICHFVSNIGQTYVLLARATFIFSAFGAFWKWYIFKNGWKDGKVGVVTGTYAVAYSFLKYLKAWYQDDSVL
jgi:hypothetical protein